MENVDAAYDELEAVDTEDFIMKTGVRQPDIAEFTPLIRYASLTDSGLDLTLAQCDELRKALIAAGDDAPLVDAVRAWALEEGFDAARADAIAALAVKVMSRVNLRQYAEQVRADWRYQ